MNLTRPLVDKLTLPKGKTEAIIFDDAVPGFGIRIREGGSRVWVFQYKLGEKHRRMTLGSVSAISLVKAREIAADHHAKVRLGQDPQGEKEQGRVRAAETFGACVQIYLAWQRKRVRWSTYRDIERHLLKNLSRLHELRVSAIGRREIATELTRIGTDSPTQANRTRASLSHFFTWAMGEGLAENNPSLLTNKNDEKPRKRVLKNEELRKIWLALPEGDYGDIVKLLILTGQREREISELTWPEIDFRQNIISLPEERTKNHRPHIIPLSKPARAILDSRPRIEDRELVFGIGEGGFTGWSRAKERLDEKVKIPPWVIHDLRRTCATGMGEIGIQPHIIEAILNHVSGHKAGVAGIYNKATYEAEKTAVLARWAEHVVAIVEDRESNVTPLRA
jgi:integrase